MPEVIYERTFYPDSGPGEAWAVIVDYSDPAPCGVPVRDYRAASALRREGRGDLSE